MNTKTVPGLIICTLMCLPVAVWANPGQKGQATTAKMAAEIAQQRHEGKVLSVNRDGDYFKVKILHEGKVNYVMIKAQ